MESLDILYLTLSACAAVLTVFISITLVYLLFILRDVTQTTDKVKELIEKVDSYVTKPILMTKNVVEYIVPFIESATEKMTTGKKKKKGK